MRLTAMIIACLSLLAGCGGGPPGGSAPDAAEGWTFRHDGDLNAFFDCLDDEGVTLVSAHRGGPAPGFPENAVETFARTLSMAPALIEFDVAASADGVLYLMHDDTLDRTTDGEGGSDSLPWTDIQNLNLMDQNGRATGFHPPPLLTPCLLRKTGPSPRSISSGGRDTKK